MKILKYPTKLKRSQMVLCLIYGVRESLDLWMVLAIGLGDGSPKNFPLTTNPKSSSSQFHIETKTVLCP